MKKLIGILVASLMILQSFAVMAADVEVSGDVNVRPGNSTGLYTDTVTTTYKGFDYEAKLDLTNARNAYKENYETALETAKTLGVPEENVTGTEISGQFKIVINVPKGMSIPTAFSEGKNLYGFTGIDPETG